MGRQRQTLPWENLSLSAQRQFVSPMGRQRQSLSLPHWRGQTETNSLCQWERGDKSAKFGPIGDRDKFSNGQRDKFSPWADRDKLSMGRQDSLFPWENLSLSAHGRICLSALWRGCLIWGEFVSVCPLRVCQQTLSAHGQTLSHGQTEQILPWMERTLCPMGESPIGRLSLRQICLQWADSL